MHWLIRAVTEAFIDFFSVQMRIEYPGRPSGVSEGESGCSIPASQGQ